MNVCEKAVRTWGHEDARTITICVLVEQGKTDLAEQLFEVLTEGEDDSYDEWDDADLEMGFDPHSECDDFD